MSTGTPYFAVNASATSGSRGAVPDMTDRTLARFGRIEVRIEHHSERGGHEADGLGTVTTHRVDPAVDRESLEQRDPAPVEHRLEHAEQSPEVHQRCVHDHDAFAQTELGALVRLVVLGSLHDPLEHRVAEVDALRWPGRAAREHPHRDAGKHRMIVTRLAPQVEVRSRAEVVDGENRGTASDVVVDERVDVRRLTDQEGHVERFEVGAHALGAQMRVHDDDAALRAQHAEEQPHRSRSVAQHHAHGRSAGRRCLRHRRGDVVRGCRDVRPGVPATVELERRCRGIEREDGLETLRERAHGHRILGVVGGIASRSTTAMPSGFPIRVYMSPCSMAAR